MTSQPKTIILHTLPACDFCGQEGIDRPARYDAPTVLGPWAHMCEAHMDGYGLRNGLARRLATEGEVA